MAPYNKYTLSTLPEARPSIQLWETSSKAAGTWFDQENLQFYATLVVAGRDGCCQFAPSFTLFSFVSVRSHRGGWQGLLLTCNNSRGYGFPPLPKLTPGSSPGNRVKLETEHNKQDERSTIPWNLQLATWGTWKYLSEETKGNVAQWIWQESSRGSLLCFVLCSTSHFFYRTSAESGCR